MHMKLSEANRLRILYFLIFSCTAAWLPIFADYLKDHKMNGIRIGIILSVTPLLMFLIQPLYGIFADHIGYKKCLLFSAFFGSITYVFYLFTGGFAYLLTVTIFMSFFYNSIQPLLDSLSLTFIQKNKSFSYGTLRIAGAAGWACTGILAGYFIDRLNTTVIFVFSAASMLLTFLLAFALRIDKTGKISSAQISVWHDLRHIFKIKRVMFLLLCVMLIYAASTPVYYFYSIYMKENGASSSLIGFAISLQGLCELPLFYFSARIIARLGIKTTLLVSIFTTALRMLLYSLIKVPEFAVFIELLHGIAWSLFWVACVEQVNVLVQEEYRATGQSFLSSAMLGAGAIVGNLWAGYLYQEHMKVADLYILNAGIVSMIGIFILLMMRPSGEGTTR
jgi:PPP family 3-phenylpropionic acid transporter